MSYNITRFNGTSIIALADGTINTSLDVTLVGKNYAGYGLPQNENFVHLLENFSNDTPPTSPISGEVWFDSTTTNLKLNVNDGSGWKTVANMNVGPTPNGTNPTSGEGGTFVAAPLTIGDMWWDTINNQLNVSNGPGFTLVGPQSVTGFAATQMQSVNQQGVPIQKAVVNGNTIFTVSSAQVTGSTLGGFPTIFQGITLNSGFKLYGTATNADTLNNLSSSYFAPISNPSFLTGITTTDSGVQIGTPFNLSNVSGVPTITNSVGNTLSFQTTASGVLTTPLQMVGADVLPGTPTSNLGTSANKWYTMYANTFNGVATKSLTLNVNGQYLSANVDGSVPNTVVARDANGAIYSPAFYGALHGNADTSSYSADGAHAAVADVANAVLWTNVNNRPTNFVFNDGNQTAWNINISGNVSGNTTGTHTGPVIGNVIGNVTGNITGNHIGNITGSLISTDNSTTMIDAVIKQIGYFGASLVGNLQGSLTGNVTGSLISTDNSTTMIDAVIKQIGYFGANLQGNLIGNVTGNVTGNASTATRLQTTRTIANIPFDGTANINPSTDNIYEGVTNKYYTDARARSAISVSGGLSYNPNSGVINGPVLAPVAVSGDYNQLINKPYIPPGTNFASLNNNLSNIVDSIVGAIDLNLNSSSYNQSILGHDSAVVGYGSGWSSAITGGSSGSPVVTFTIDIPTILGLSNSSSSLYWKGNYSFNLAPSLTRVYDNRSTYYSFGTGVWSISASPVTSDSNSSQYGVFTVQVSATDLAHPYHGTSVSAGWIGLSSRTSNVYSG
jgi:hypothetical protein